LKTTELCSWVGNCAVYGKRQGELNWVGEKPEIREGLVKTGWKIWREKWRELAFKMAKNNIIIGKNFARLSAF
jgi:hypothetical protein